MRLIFVTGMHRSGTSFLTELVAQLGASTGEGLLDPAPDNPHGFFERNDVRALNDQLLRRLGGRWDTPPTGLGPTWAESAAFDDLRARAAELIEQASEEAGTAPALVMKDPRFALTGRFWRTVVTLDRCVVIVRNPSQVFDSLRRRNGMSAARAATLWTRYTVDAIRSLDDPIVVALDSITSSPESAVSDLAEHLGLPITDEAIALASGRTRTWSGPDTGPPATGDEVALADAVYQMLTRLDVANVAPVLTTIADAWGPAGLFDLDAAAVQDPANPAVGVLASAARRFETLEATAIDHRAQIERITSERDTAERNLRAARSELERHQRTAGETIKELERSVDDERTARRTEQARANELAAQLDEQTATFEQRLAAVETGEGGRSEALERAEHERDSAARRARRAEEEYDRLKGRRSVRAALRLTAPLAPAVRSTRRIRNRRTRRDRPTPGRSGGNTSATDGRSPRATAHPTPTPGSRYWTDVVTRLGDAPDCTVVVPVYNAVDETRACLESVVRWTPRSMDIVVIDDCSTDPRIAGLLEEFATGHGIRILHNDENLGFTRTVNRGFSVTSGDVIILNSDARVTPNWAIGLRVAAYGGDLIASSSAVSDNAGAFSVPEPGANDSTGLDDDSLARLQRQRSGRRWIDAPTGHGFCMYLRRDALDDVGHFDDQLFPRGYGEENDWSMRAIERGWSHVLDDTTMVFHTNAASFDPDAKLELVAAARETLNRRHPTYTERVREFTETTIAPVRADARAIFTEARTIANPAGVSVRPRLLSVVQAGRGGTPQTNLDLMSGLAVDWEPWVLECDGRNLRLFRLDDGTRPDHPERTVRATQPLGANRQSDPAAREFIAEIIATFGFELVHVRHLFKHSQRDLPDVLDAIGVPSVLSFHDFYFVCPNVNLVDERGQFCGGHCTSTPGDCELPVPGKPLDVRLKDRWVYEWREQSADLLHSFDQLVTTSESARALLEEHIPDLRARGINVIPHGRELVDERSAASPPTPELIRIALIGNLNRPKGGDFLRELLALDRDRRLDIHIVGEADDEYADLRCTYHGSYERSDLGNILRDIAPSFAAVWSIWPETWSHTLTEAWSMGLPVLVSRHGGAVPERVERRGGGWVIDTDHPAEALARMVEITGDLTGWQQQRSKATVADHSDIATMAAAYQQVYERARSRATGDAPVVDVRVVRDDAGKSPGSAHVRALRRFGHPSVRSGVVSSSDGRSRAGTSDVVWVERTAVAEHDVESLLIRQQHGLALVVDLDDDLLHPDGLPASFASVVDTTRRLVEHADLVTVSTPALGEVVRDFNENVEVLPNVLDDRLWGILDDPSTHDDDDRGDLQLFYMGTETHADDLELLREPIEIAERQLGRRVRLNVVGGAPERGTEWFRRIPVPADRREYTAFVPWLKSVAQPFDVAVAPLVDNRFTRSKSDLKFLEYSALGLPGIFSEVEAYRHTVEHDVNGLLAATPDQWVESIVTMADAQRRRKLTEAAAATASLRTVARTADDFIGLIERLVTARLPR